jgi:hypothetical protein
MLHELYLQDQVLSPANQMDALMGTSGTPLVGNRFVTSSDPRLNDASTSTHGLLPKLSGSATDFLNGSGNWSIPGRRRRGHPVVVDQQVIVTGLAQSDDGRRPGLVGTKRPNRHSASCDRRRPDASWRPEVCRRSPRGCARFQERYRSCPAPPGLHTVGGGKTGALIGGLDGYHHDGLRGALKGATLGSLALSPAETVGRLGQVLAALARLEGGAQ